MADESDSKPAAPSGEASQPSTPAPSDPVQDVQSTSPAATPAEPASSVSNVTTPAAPASASATSSSTGNAAARPETSTMQGQGQQDNSSSAVQQQQAPSLPARNYPRDPQWLTYGTLPAALPSRVLPKFFKALALVIFITGTSATLFTLLYQRLVLPKLLLTRARLASLHQHQVSLYDKLLLSAHSLIYSDNSLYPKSQRQLAGLHASDPTLPSAAQEDMAKVEGLPLEKPISESDEEEPLFADESPLEKCKELVFHASTPDESIISRLQLSLQTLRSSLQRHSNLSTENVAVSNEAEDDESPLMDQTQSQKTMKSLEELSTYLTNEAFYASTPAFSSASYGWNYAGSSSIPQRSGMDRDKIAQVKNEIRSLKGMLLTRRNFALPKQETSV